MVGMSLIAACRGVTAAGGYELYEWAVDHWFGQHLFIGETDTITDLADGFLGAALGGALLAVWAVARYTSRRLPPKLAPAGADPALGRARAAADGVRACRRFSRRCLRVTDDRATTV
jgi:hypothetical protein